MKAFRTSHFLEESVWWLLPVGVYFWLCFDQEFEARNPAFNHSEFTTQENVRKLGNLRDYERVMEGIWLNYLDMRAYKFKKERQTSKVNDQRGIF